MSNRTGSIFLALFLWTTVGASAVRADDFHTNTRDRLAPLPPSERRKTYNSRTSCERRQELAEKWSGLKSVELTIQQYDDLHAYRSKIFAFCTQSCQPGHVRCTMYPGNEQIIARLLQPDNRQAEPKPSERPWWDTAWCQSGEAKGWRDGIPTPNDVPGGTEAVAKFIIENYFGVHEKGKGFALSLPELNKLVGKLDDLEPQRKFFEDQVAALQRERARINRERRRAHWRDQKLENQFTETERKLFALREQISEFDEKLNRIHDQIKQLNTQYTCVWNQLGLWKQKYPSPQELNFPTWSYY